MEVMRNGCLPYLGKIYLWKRKSKKEEKIAAKAHEVSKSITGKNNDKSYEKRVMVECMSEDVVGKSHVHDSIAANKDNSLCESIVVNRTQAKQDSTQDHPKKMEGYKEDQEKLMRGYNRGPCVPKFGEWSTSSDEGFELEFGGAARGERNKFNKVKTFDLRGVKFGRAARGERNEFNKVKTFDLRGVKFGEAARGERNEFNKVKTFDLRGVKEQRQVKKSN